MGGQKVALVVGDSGLVGSNLVRHLAGRGGWRVLGASRSPDRRHQDYQHISLDLTNPDSVRRTLGNYPEITHVFMAARLRDTAYETIDEQAVTATRNVGLLRVVLDAVEPVAQHLTHVHVVQGNKWYGPGIGPTHPPVPAREDSPRALAPNAYYAQQDFLVDRQAGQSWTWSAIRPGVILGFAPGYPNNIVALVGAYAAICRDVGVPLRFPGTEACYRLIQSAVTVEILCEAITWIAEREECTNNAFNVSNGDVYSWATLWPKVADFFGIPVGAAEPMPFSAVMRTMEHVWPNLVDKHALAAVPITHVVDWPYGDYHFQKTKGDVTSVIKLLQTGFHHFADTDSAFLSALESYRKARLLP